MANPPPRILVTGATGAIGPCVVEELLAAGYAVRILVRKLPVEVVSSAVELRLGDITDPAAVARAMADCVGVVHMAALLHIVNPSPALRAEYARINVAGTVNVIQAALTHDVQRLVFFSTIAVYGSQGGQVLTEATPPQPDSHYGASKLAAEKLVLAAQRADGERLGVVLRLAAVYGARVKGNYQRLLAALARGYFLPIGKGANQRTLVYDRDVASAALLVLDHPAAAGQIYNVTDGCMYTLQEITLAICAALHRQPPRLYIPIMPVRLFVTLLEAGLALAGRSSPLGRATLEKYLEEMRVDGSYIQQTLSFAPRYTLAAGWAEIVQQPLNLSQ